MTTLLNANNDDQNRNLRLRDTRSTQAFDAFTRFRLWSFLNILSRFRCGISRVVSRKLDDQRRL